jgi:hypothetical protein
MEQTFRPGGRLWPLARRAGAGCALALATALALFYLDFVLAGFPLDW